MYGLTSLGVVHTLISLIAVAAGVWALARHKEIALARPPGKTYVVTTLLTALTGLGIYQHGGFGPPQVLSILTIPALAAGAAIELKGLLGAWSRQAQAIAYTTTMLFHMIPAFTETLTRVPLGAPLLPNAEAPEFKPIYGTLMLIYVVGLVLQLRWLRGQSTKPLTGAAA